MLTTKLISQSQLLVITIKHKTDTLAKPPNVMLANVAI